MIHLWDILLLTAVSLMGTAMAYVRHPQHKALIFSLPIPFTLATLSLNKPVDASHVMGLAMLLVYVHGVRVLHQTLRCPIVLAIAIAVMADVILSAMLATVLPTGENAFWLSLAFVTILGGVLFARTPHRQENSHRTSLTVIVKLPIIIGVVSVLIAIKHLLRGFMGFFPMVGLIAAYESRHSLWALCRQVPALILIAAPMLTTIRLCQNHMPLGCALACGWGAMLFVWVPLQWKVILSLRSLIPKQS